MSFRFLRRVVAIAGKEWLHVRRDPRTLYVSLGMPVVLLLIFGYGVSFDLDRLPVAIVDQDGTATSRDLGRRVTAGEDFLLAAELVDTGPLDGMFLRGTAVAAVVVPVGFEESVRRGRPMPLQLLVDGADANTATQALARLHALLPAMVGPPSAPVVEVRTHTLFNPAGLSAFSLVPGLTALVMAIVAVVLTALAVAREWEEGSMEQLFATPVGRMEIILGKLLPYLALGSLAMAVVILLGMTAFGLPLRGPVGVLVLSGLLFLVGMLGQGLLISVITRNQMVATQAASLSSMLPSMLLSGFIFPIENMPRPLQLLTHAVPARYFVECVRGVMLRGNGLGILWPQLVALAVFAVVIVSLAVARFQRRLA